MALNNYKKYSFQWMSKGYKNKKVRESMWNKVELYRDIREEAELCWGGG